MTGGLALCNDCLHIHHLDDQAVTNSDDFRCEHCGDQRDHHNVCSCGDCIRTACELLVQGTMDGKPTEFTKSDRIQVVDDRH